DRYEYKMENYAASKLRITQNQREGDYFIYNQEDKLINQFFKPAVFAGQTIPFSLDKKEHTKAWFEDKNVVLGFVGEIARVSTEKSPRIGKHNQYNSLAAISVAKLLGLTEAQIEAAL